MAKLNFQPEPFGEQLEHGSKKSGGHGHHGGHRRRWGWMHRMGSGGDSQSGSSMDCLAQVTGDDSLRHRRGIAVRRAIRKFQQQQQLPPTGRLDPDTTAALQSACSDDGDGGDGF